MSAVLFAAAARLHPGDGYALAYGSHATHPGPTSDLDLLYTGTGPLTPAALTRLIQDVKVLHSANGLDLDEEVAYATKLYATHDDIQAATRLEGFAGATTYATPLGDPAALNSHGFKLRLLLNVLTTPHVFLGGDVHTYRHHVTRAERATVLLALRIADAPKLALHQAVDALLSSPEGHTGQAWLGYQPSPHLYAVVRRGLAHLAHEHLVHVRHDEITWRPQ
ncbi:hypothetical protein HRW14_07360 [Streptomyces lunaelactis]|uniref:hypothetical protein n=1 Tax=Streptomyces lunaelactis TaxID=1535768 RepID=UPI001584CD34|nr:hypothetical protein [Streptomyces lunaelactis]NUK50117.1 hypothetical protein [Streptomyces lunaelactis]